MISDPLQTARFALALTLELVPLFLLVSTMVYLATDRLTPERLRLALGGRGAWIGIPAATVLGAVTPFCSCSTVPLAQGLVRARVPTSTLVAFLIASPLVSPVAIALLWGHFGVRYALYYALSGMTLAAFGGALIGRGPTAGDALVAGCCGEEACGTDSCSTLPSEPHPESVEPNWLLRLLTPLSIAFQKSLTDLRKLAVPLAIAIVVGALIHNNLPAETLARIAGPESLFAIPIAALLGVPVYASVVVLLPLGAGLLAKGASVGAVTAFLMAASGFSLPEGILLSRLLPRRILVEIVLFFTAGVIGIGYGFQYFVH